LKKRLSSKKFQSLRKIKMSKVVAMISRQKATPSTLKKKKKKQLTTAWQSIIKFDPFPFGRIVGFWDEDRPRRSCFPPREKKKKKRDKNFKFARPGPNVNKPLTGRMKSASMACVFRLVKKGRKLEQGIGQKGETSFIRLHIRFDCSTHSTRDDYFVYI
jgi:hypothetical protein